MKQILTFSTFFCIPSGRGGNWYQLHYSSTSCWYLICNSFRYCCWIPWWCRQEGERFCQEWRIFQESKTEWEVLYWYVITHNLFNLFKSKPYDSIELSWYQNTGCATKKFLSLKLTFSKSKSFKQTNLIKLERRKINLNFDGSFIKFDSLDQKLCSIEWKSYFQKVLENVENRHIKFLDLPPGTPVEVLWINRCLFNRPSVRLLPALLEIGSLVLSDF